MVCCIISPVRRRVCILMNGSTCSPKTEKMQYNPVNNQEKADQETAQVHVLLRKFILDPKEVYHVANMTPPKIQFV